MLCPCCGDEIKLDVVQCNCGARFIGAPLDEKPVHIKSYGHVMNTFGLLAVVTTAALVFTKFFAIGAIPVIWYTWRSLKLSRNNPQQFGGYKVLAPTFALTLIASFVIAGLTVAYIPRFLRNREAKKTAASVAAMHHKYALLAEYMAAKGTYPDTEQELREFVKEPIPSDYWGHNIRYTGYTDSIATMVPNLTPTGMRGSDRTSLATNTPQKKGNKESMMARGFALTNFELRSNGPDELPNTADDIIMKDGIIYTAAELKSQTTAPVKASAK
jgi:hypothetical protein